LFASYLVFTEIRASNGATDGLAGVLGIGIFAVLGIPLLLSVILGPLLSLFIWHNRHLLTMSALSFILILLLAILGSATWAPLLFTYGIACTVIGSRRLNTILDYIKDRFI